MQGMLIDFVSGGEVDYAEMLKRGLIEKNHGGYVLTDLGSSLLRPVCGHKNN